MTRALVVGPGPHVVAALERAGVAAVEQVEGDLVRGLCRLAAVLREGGEPVVVVDGDAVLPVAALARLADDPSVGSGLLVSSGGVSVRAAHGRVVSAGSEHHHVSSGRLGSLGALVIAERDAEAAVVALEEMARTAELHRWSGDVVDHAAVALVRRTVPLRAVPVHGPAVRSRDAPVREAVARQLAEGGDEQAMRDSGNRADDGFYSTFVLRRLSKPLTELAIRLRLTPNQVSVLSLLAGLGAAALFARGGLGASLAGALLLQLSIVVDCVDGEVARRTRRFSALGAWLDASTDRVKEFAAYAGLAHAADAWLLAAVVLTVQTVRHMTDYDFQRVHTVRETWVEPRDLAEASDGGALSYGAAVEASQRASGHPAVYWAKKAVHLPIGERWLVLSLGAVLLGPRATLFLLLVLGLVAAAYTTVGRLLRVRHWAHPLERSGHEALDPQVDLLTARPNLGGPLGWALPGVLRLLELATVVVLTEVVAPDAMPWAYALAFVLAFHHYDTLYRALGGAAPPAWLVRGALGVEGRVLVLLVAAAAGEGALRGVLVAGAVGLGAWCVVVASVQSVRSLRVSA